MTFYRYKAIGKDGTIQKGVLEVSSKNELKTYLQDGGLSLITCSSKTSLFHSRIKPRLLMDLCLHLEQFEKAGVPLKESLEEFHQVQPLSQLKFIIAEVIKDIEGGLLFSKALLKHPYVFDPVFLGLIAVGEKTGHLSFIFHQLYLHLKWIDEIQAQVFKALRYPLIMVSVLLIAIFILMIALIPELIIFVKNFSGELPLSTQLLLRLSGFLSEYMKCLLVGLGIISAILFVFFKCHSKGQMGKDFLLDVLPFIGSLRYKMALTRFCHIFAIMIESGIDILQALPTARKFLKHRQMYQALENVEKFVREGFSLSDSLQKTKFFPPMMVRMLRMGEQTSSLQTTLLHVKNYFDVNLKRQVDHTVGLIEPVMILCIGILMGLIIYSVFLPLYDTLTVLDF